MYRRLRGQMGLIRRSFLHGVARRWLRGWLRHGAPSRPVKFARFEAMRSDLVEIVIGDVVVRAVGDVEPDRLADVIRAVRKA